MFLEMDCMGVYFFYNCQIRKYYYFRQVPTHLKSNILGPTSKLKLQLPIFLAFGPISKEVCHAPIGQKLTGGDRLSRNRPFLPQGHTLEAS
jgi:hypothetical protein